MKDFTIAIHCFLDDLLQKIQNNQGGTDKRRKITVVTILLNENIFIVLRYLKDLRKIGESR